MTDWTHCPEVVCGAPAEVLDDWHEISTGGPVRHVRTRCARGHVRTTHDGRPFDPPMARQLPCPACRHEHHAPLLCDQGGCTCRDVPVPGVYS